MFYESLLAYTHYISFLVVIATLVAEAVVFRDRLSANERKRLQQLDALYGISAILVLVTGFVRVFYSAKGIDYYFHNYIFLGKAGLFLLVGLLSIYPTVVFLRWRKIEDEVTVLTLDPAQYKKINLLIRLEVVILFIIPLLAALMARGMGYYG